MSLVRTDRDWRGSGFTLVEMMVALALVSLIALLLLSMTNSTATIWRQTTGRIEQFRSADAAFESVTRRLSQATLNTFWDYDNPNAPKKYFRQSDLRFIIGTMTKGPKPLLTVTSPRRPTHGVFFQAPLGFVDDPANFGGLSNLINTWGYYVEFNQDVRPKFIEDMPDGLPKRYRYRLMEFMQPSNALSIYSFTSGKPAYTGKDWFSAGLVPGAPEVLAPSVHVLGENIVALVLQPKLSKRDEISTGKQLSKDYAYDSTTTNADPDINPKNQLPPVVQVTLVAIDEASANRLANGAVAPGFDAMLDAIFFDTSKLDADLNTLQKALSEFKPPVSFRIFTTSVGIRAAKWSRK